MKGARSLLGALIVVALFAAATVMIAQKIGIPRRDGDALRRLHSATGLRGIVQGLETFANNSNGVYPDGFGELIHEGYISPEMLLSKTDPRSDLFVDDVEEYDWQFDDPDPAFDELSRFAADRSSFIVLVWRAPRDALAGELIAYQRLDAGREVALVAFGPYEVEWIPREQAVKEIHAAGHEPVWADDQ